MVSCEQEWKKTPSTTHYWQTHFSHLRHDHKQTSNYKRPAVDTFSCTSCSYTQQIKPHLCTDLNNETTAGPPLLVMSSLYQRFTSLILTVKNENVPMGYKISIICKKSLHYKVKSFEEDIASFHFSRSLFIVHYKYLLHTHKATCRHIFENTYQTDMFLAVSWK